MTFPSSIPPAHVAGVIDAAFGPDAGPRVSIDAGGLPCEDTSVACPADGRNVPLRFSRWGWAIAHPLRPWVVNEHIMFGLWVGECQECGVVYFGERKLEP